MESRQNSHHKTFEVNEAVEMLSLRKQLTLKYRVLTQWRLVSRRRPQVSSPKIMKARSDNISKYAKQYYTSINSIQMQSVISDFNTNSSEDLEAQRRRFKQLKQRESLSRQYSDEKHPKKLSHRSSHLDSLRASSLSDYGESAGSELVSGRTQTELSYGSETISYYEHSVRSSRFFTKRQLAKLKRIVNNFLIFRLKSKLLIQFQKWKRLCGQRTVFNQRKTQLDFQASLKPQTLDIFDHFDSKADIQTYAAAKQTKKVAFTV